DRFLLSAAHVFDEHESGLLYVEQAGQFLPLTRGRLLRSTFDNRNRWRDHLDIAIVYLSDKEYSAIPSDDFLTIDDFDPNEVANESNMYIALGYPAVTCQYLPEDQHSHIGLATWTAPANINAYEV